jgi:hypothetical protein
MARKTIKLLGEPVQNEDDKAVEAITPGHLVAYDSNGNLVKHATAGGDGPAMFALEREEHGWDISDGYASNDVVKVGAFPPGTRVNAWLASGYSVVKGAFLESAGNGTLRTRTGTNRIFAQALEAVTNGGQVTAARIRAQVM